MFSSCLNNKKETSDKSTQTDIIYSPTLPSKRLENIIRDRLIGDQVVLNVPLYKRRKPVKIRVKQIGFNKRSTI